MLANAAFAATDFTLDDQFGRSHRRGDVFGDSPVVIIAGAQRKTPDAMQAWDRALRERLTDGAPVYGLSNLKKLPFFVPKGAVRRNLAELLPKTPVLMDWKGAVYPGLGFPDGATVSVGVFEANGKRVGIVTGEANDARVAEVLKLVARER
jgi:hypothetical protein